MSPRWGFINFFNNYHSAARCANDIAPLGLYFKFDSARAGFVDRHF